MDSEVTGDSVGLRLKSLNFVDIVVCATPLLLDCMLLRLETFNLDIVEDAFQAIALLSAGTCFVQYLRLLLLCMCSERFKCSWSVTCMGQCL